MVMINARQFPGRFFNPYIYIRFNSPWCLGFSKYINEININLQTKVLFQQLFKKLSVLLCNLVFECRVHKTPSYDLALKQMNTANILTPCFFEHFIPEIYLNNVLK